MSDSLVVVIEEIAKNVELIKDIVFVACCFLSGILAGVWFRK